MQNRESILRAFGAAIRLVRTDLNMTQEDLAAAAGFDRTYISLVERGKRNLSLVNIHRFADALHAAPSDLMRITENGPQTGRPTTCQANTSRDRRSPSRPRS